MNGEAEGSAVGTRCVCWIVRRDDGRVLGFTDHDHDLLIEDVVCRADTGMQATEAAERGGLGADGQDVVGALDSSAIREADIAAGRYDGARVDVWSLNWRQPEQRSLR